MWQVWIILAGIFVIFEMIIPTDFLVFWLGMGALVAAVTSIFVDNITVQIGVFVISSILLVFLTRPFVKKFMKNSANISTNVYSAIGKTGIVISDIDPITGKGKIKVENEIWSAKTNNQEKIQKDTLVKVDAIDGVKAVVSVCEESTVNK